jgi:two-component system LytT family sensor kinase
MNRSFVHNILFRLGAPLVAGFLAYLLILLIYNSVQGLNAIFSNLELYVAVALSYLAFTAMRWIILAIDRYGKNWVMRRRIVLQTLFTLAGNLGIVGIAISTYYLMFVGFSIGRYELNVFLAIFGATGLLYNLLYFSHFYLLQENRSRIDEERKLQEKVEADFVSFRSEINPDLLYESLENLILTIHHNTDEAEEQIDYLAGIYRYSLVNRQKELIGLDEELRAATNLINLVNYRYQKQLNLISDIPNQQEIFLIPGSLMITIDTVIRNTLISQKSPLVIRLYLEEEDDYLVLQHTLNDRLQLHQESLQAFTRLQRSYTFFSDKPFVQVKAGKENYIKFPMIRVDSVIANDQE